MLRQKSIGMSWEGWVSTGLRAGEGDTGRVTVHSRNKGAWKCSFMLPYVTTAP